jgi:hypothetical protein
MPRTAVLWYRSPPDIEETNGTVTILKGTTSANVTITVLNAAIFETPEAFTVVASNRSCPYASFRSSRWNLLRGAAVLRPSFAQRAGGLAMNNLIYLVGLVVVVIAILSFFGLR